MANTKVLLNKEIFKKIKANIRVTQHFNKFISNSTTSKTPL
jgi:predicted glycosyl hydrolase (DUF1957 family)